MTLNDASQLAQIAGTVAVVATFFIMKWQLVAMQGQVTAARDSSRTQNLLSLIDYIQRPEHRTARRALFALEGIHFTEWTSEDRKNAEMACSAWDTVGLVLKNTEIPRAKEMIVDNWRHSIFRCHQLTHELKQHLREERDPEFWNDLDWLQSLALRGYVVDGTALRRT